MTTSPEHVAAEALKACPHCGADTLSVSELFNSPPETFYSVYCAECGGSGPEDTVREKAIAAWNRRQSPASHANAVKVRPLTWTYDASAHAETPFGKYLVWDLPSKEWSVEGPNGFLETADTMAAAQAVAQADYERRILSALTASPSPAGAVAPAAALAGAGLIERFNSYEIMLWLDGREPQHDPAGEWVRYSDHLAALATPVAPAAGVNPYADAIYIASKTKHAESWKQIASVLPVSSTWIYEAGEGETSDFNDLWTRCLKEASNSKALVAYHEEGEVMKGAWAEMGAAMACGVPVHAVGFENYTIGKSGLITHHATMDEAVRAALNEPRRAALQPAGVDGWRLVPVEPTDDMMEAFAETMSDERARIRTRNIEAGRPNPNGTAVVEWFASAYRAMLDAAPLPSPTASHAAQGGE